MCDLDQTFASPEALLPHLEETHSDQFTTDQLRKVSRQRVIEQPQAWNECPICGFTVEEAPRQSIPALPKRQKTSF